MSTEIQRYSDDENGDIIAHEAGFFVLFSDYEAMRGDRDCQIAFMRGKVESLTKEIESLKDRLVKKSMCKNCGEPYDAHSYTGKCLLPKRRVYSETLTFDPET